eukprot:1508753-Amphidinium_carterae.1
MGGTIQGDLMRSKDRGLMVARDRETLAVGPFPSVGLLYHSSYDFQEVWDTVLMQAGFFKPVVDNVLYDWRVDSGQEVLLHSFVAGRATSVPYDPVPAQHA